MAEGLHFGYGNWKRFCRLVGIKMKDYEGRSLKNAKNYSLRMPVAEGLRLLRFNSFSFSSYIRKRLYVFVCKLMTCKDLSPITAI